jgi:ureidoglycolate lyase
MQMTTIQELSLEAFCSFGTYGNMVCPSGPLIDGGAFVFYRDMVRLDLGQATQASFSVCQVNKRENVIDVLECHDGCGEMLMPIDGDVLMQLGHATNTGQPPMEDLKVFRIPAGTLVCLYPGVWHHAPYALNCDQVNILVALPERTYAKDALVVELPKDQQIKIK